jgi:hypothetical protein
MAPMSPATPMAAMAPAGLVTLFAAIVAKTEEFLDPHLFLLPFPGHIPWLAVCCLTNQLDSGRMSLQVSQ